MKIRIPKNRRDVKQHLHDLLFVSAYFPMANTPLFEECRLLLPDLRCQTTLRSRGCRSRLSADLCNGAPLVYPPCSASTSG